MKKLTAIILTLTFVFLLTGCSQGGDVKTVSEKPENFLADMAKGISVRLEMNEDEDTSSWSDDDFIKNYSAYVQAELDCVSKYENAVFEGDETLTKYAHDYVLALNLQLYGAQHYKENIVFSSYWDSGRKLRCGIIAELYEKYKLDITKEQYSDYKNYVDPTVASITWSIEPEEEETISDNTDKISYELLEYKKGNSNYAILLLTNNSDKDLRINTSVLFMDGSGNVVDSWAAFTDVVSGQTFPTDDYYIDVDYAKCEVTIESTEAPYHSFGKAMVPYDSIEYSANEVKEGKIMFAVTNNTTSTLIGTELICIFYNGKNVVDWDHCFPKNAQDELKPDETIYKEITTYKEYTSYKVFTQGWIKE